MFHRAFFTFGSFHLSGHHFDMHIYLDVCLRLYLLLREVRICIALSLGYDVTNKTKDVGVDVMGIVGES